MSRHHECGRQVSKSCGVPGLRQQNLLETCLGIFQASQLEKDIPSIVMGCGEAGQSLDRFAVRLQGQREVPRITQRLAKQVMRSTIGGVQGNGTLKVSAGLAMTPGLACNGAQHL
jgi:hypothetical protein